MKINPNRHSRLSAMAKIILGGLLVSAVLFVAAGYFLPVQFKLDQSIEVNAPAAYLYEEINDLEKWPVWSYWFADNTEVTYAGDRTGIGASCSWKSNGDEGTATILRNISDEMVSAQLEFPGSGSAKCEFRIEPDSLNPTIIRLTMLADLSANDDGVWARWKGFILATRFSAVLDHNLANLKKIAEGKPIFSGGISEELLAPSYYISAEIPATEGQPTPSGIIEGLTTLNGVLQQAKVTADGPPFCILAADSVHQILCCIPVPPDARLPVGYPISQFYSGAAIRAIDSTGYAGVKATHHEVMRYIRYKEYIVNGPPWEVYVTNPTRIQDPSQWTTHVYYPVLDQ